MTREKIGMNVLDAAVNRLEQLYSGGHELVVSFSGGKDSGVTLETAIIAAQKTNRLPVKVIMRDEEIMFPGTFEYAERVADRDEVDFHWIYANQPIINIFNREEPYWWVFDPQLNSEQWVRQPPDIAYRIDDLNIDSMTTPERFPVEDGQRLYAVIGLRVSESRGRLYGLYSSGGYVTKPNKHGVQNVRPVYDWLDGDVWRAIQENDWDYNRAYDQMSRLGVSRSRLRIAPPTMSRVGVPTLQTAMRAWPRWFDKVAERVPGIRAAAKYGLKSVTPYRRLNETWEQCYYRTCIHEAPAWIGERSELQMKRILKGHRKHSNNPFPEIDACYNCYGNIGSWKKLTETMYGGDPFSMKTKLPYVEPERFREGAGMWDGKPGF